MKQLFALLALMIGCAPNPPIAAGPPAPPRGPDSATVRCALIADSVRAFPDRFPAFRASQSRIVLPSNEGAPDSLYDRAILARLFVDETGHVVSDSTTLTPDISRSRYGKQLLETYRQQVYRSPLHEGCPVASWAWIDFTPQRHGGIVR